MNYPGPPYPAPAPIPGSFDVWSSIISQYADSPILTGIIESFNAAMDQVQNINNFYDLIWNILTAQGYGLDVWGRILNVSRTLPVSVGGGPPTFGFNEPGNDWVGFGQAPFFSGSSPTTNVTLTDLQYRPLLLAKAATNIWNGSIPGLNSILLGLFTGRGIVFVQDNLNMSLTYTFLFSLTALDTAVIDASGCLPSPTGIVINALSAPWVPVIGNTPATIFADWTTEGSGNNYWYNNTTYGSFAALLTALGGTFSRSTTATYTNSAGLLASAAINALRFDHNPVTLAPLGILLEGPSTNLQTYSAAIGITGWSASGYTATANAIEAPDGNTTATQLAESGSTTIFDINESFTFSNTTTYTASYFIAPRGGSQYVTIAFAGSGVPAYAIFDVINGIVTQTRTIGAGPTIVDATISGPWTVAGVNFFRCALTVTVASGSTTNAIYVNGTSTATYAGSDGAARQTYTGNAANGLYVGLGQVEQLGLASSYIPATTAAVTRAQDNLTIPGTYSTVAATLLVRWYGQPAAAVPYGGGLCSIDDNNNYNSNNIDLSIGDNEVQVYSGSTNEASLNFGTPLVGAFNTLAASAKVGTAASSLNGATAVTAGLAAMPVSFTNITIGDLGGNYSRKPDTQIAQFGYWPIAATPAQLQSLT